MVRNTRFRSGCVGGLWLGRVSVSMCPLQSRSAGADKGLHNHRGRRSNASERCERATDFLDGELRPRAKLQRSRKLCT